MPVLFTKNEGKLEPILEATDIQSLLSEDNLDTIGEQLLSKFKRQEIIDTIKRKIQGLDMAIDALDEEMNAIATNLIYRDFIRNNIEVHRRLMQQQGTYRQNYDPLKQNQDHKEPLISYDDSLMYIAYRFWENLHKQNPVQIAKDFIYIRDALDNLKEILEITESDIVVLLYIIKKCIQKHSEEEKGAKKTLSRLIDKIYEKLLKETHNQKDSEAVINGILASISSIIYYKIENKKVPVAVPLDDVEIRKGRRKTRKRLKKRFRKQKKQKKSKVKKT